jgi:hypothetical protein
VVGGVFISNNMCPAKMEEEVEVVEVVINKVEVTKDTHNKEEEVVEVVVAVVISNKKCMANNNNNIKEVEVVEVVINKA